MNIDTHLGWTCFCREDTLCVQWPDYTVTLFSKQLALLCSHQQCLYVLFLHILYYIWPILLILAIFIELWRCVTVVVTYTFLIFSTFSCSYLPLVFLSDISVQMFCSCVYPHASTTLFWLLKLCVGDGDRWQQLSDDFSFLKVIWLWI